MGAVPPEDNPTTRRRRHSVFYKLIVQSIILQNQLDIPRRFIEIYGDELSDVVYLTASSPGMWPVCLKKDNQRGWFRGGWQKFVADQSIHAVCFLVFKYEGNSIFHVDIYNLAAPEGNCPHIAPLTLEEFTGGKRFQLPNKKYDLDDTMNVMDHHTFCVSPSFSLKSVYDDIHQTSSSSVNNLRLFSSATTFEAKHNPVTVQRMNVAAENISIQVEEDELTENNMIETSKVAEAYPSHQAKLHYGKRKAIAEPEVDEDEFRTEDVLVVKRCTKVSLRSSPSGCKADRAFTAAVSCFKSNHPFVIVFMKPSYVSPNYRMHLPLWFAQKHLEGVSGDIMLLLHGRLWPVRFGFKSRFSGFDGKGWGIFVRDNHLEEGDACAFELVNEKDIAFKVTIFRSAEYMA